MTSPRPVFKSIIFDFDGTLVDSAPDILSTFEAAFAAEGLLPQRRIDLDVIGPPLPRAVEFLGPHLTELEQSSIVAQFRKIYDASLLERTLPYPGVSDLLQSLLSQRRQLFIATNKRSNPVHKLLRRYSWDSCFQDVLCVDSLGSAVSTKQDLIDSILKKYSLLRDEVLMVGDTRGDTEAALKNGIETAYIENGYGGPQNAEGAKWRFENIQTFGEWIL